MIDQSTQHPALKAITDKEAEAYLDDLDDVMAWIIDGLSYRDKIKMAKCLLFNERSPKALEQQRLAAETRRLKTQFLRNRFNAKREARKAIYSTTPKKAT